MKLSFAKDTKYNIRLNSGIAYLSIDGGKENYFNFDEERQNEVQFVLESICEEQDENIGFELCDLWSVLEECDNHSFEIYEGTGDELEKVIPQITGCSAIALIVCSETTELPTIVEIAGLLSSKCIAQTNLIWRAKSSSDIPAGSFKVYVLS